MGFLFRLLRAAFLAFWLILPGLLFLSDSARELARDNPYGWQDEGYILAPTTDVYLNGRGAFRCRSDRVPICYGGTQVFFDSWMLHRMDADALTREKAVDTPATPLFVQAKYPEILRTLRLSRIAWALSLCLLIAWAAWKRAGLSTAVSLAIGFGLIAIPAFKHSQLGLKNDYVAAVWIVFFSWMSSRVLARTHRSGSAWRLSLAMIFGALGLGVKATFLIPLLGLPVAYAISRALFARGLVVPMIEVAFASVLAGIAYLWANPNTWISSSEASWILAMVQVAAAGASKAQLMTEWSKITLPSTWILAPLLCLASACVLSHASNSKSWLQKFLRWGFLTSVPLLWTYLTWKAAWGRPQYYLPAVAWSLAVGITAWTEAQPRWIFQWILAAMAVAGIWSVQSPMPLLRSYSDVLASFARIRWPERSPDRVHAIDHVLNDLAPRSTGHWAVDLALRPVIRESGLPADRIVYFDSLSESPAQIARKLDPSSQVVVTCWTAGNRSTPSGLAWSEALKSIRPAPCKSWNVMSDGLLLAFENGSRPEGFATIRADQLHASAQVEVPEWTSETLSPRALRGSIQGYDAWFAPIILAHDAVLSGEFRFPHALRSVELGVESPCKDRGSIELNVGTVRDVRSADVRQETCSERPWVCRLRIEKWWMKRYPLKPLKVEFARPLQGPVKIEITAHGLDADRCRLSIQDLKLTYARNLQSAQPSRGAKIKR